MVINRDTITIETWRVLHISNLIFRQLSYIRFPISDSINDADTENLRWHLDYSGFWAPFPSQLGFCFSDICNGLCLDETILDHMEKEASISAIRKNRYFQAFKYMRPEIYHINWHQNLSAVQTATALDFCYFKRPFTNSYTLKFTLMLVDLLINLY